MSAPPGRALEVEGVEGWRRPVWNPDTEKNKKKQITHIFTGSQLHEMQLKLPAVFGEKCQCHLQQEVHGVVEVGDVEPLTGGGGTWGFHRGRCCKARRTEAGTPACSAGSSDTAWSCWAADRASWTEREQAAELQSGQSRWSEEHLGGKVRHYQLHLNTRVSLKTPLFKFLT